MSGDDELDKLLSSLSSTSKKKKKSAGQENQAGEDQQPAQVRAESDQASGIDPLDVVGLTDEQRKVLNWLSRHQRSSFEDIQEAVAIPPDELQDLLNKLVEEKRIRAAIRKDQTLYSAPIHGQASRRLRGFPEDLWKKAGLDDD